MNQDSNQSRLERRRLSQRRRREVNRTCLQEDINILPSTAEQRRCKRRRVTQQRRRATLNNIRQDQNQQVQTRRDRVFRQQIEHRENHVQTVRNQVTHASLANQDRQSQQSRDDGIGLTRGWRGCSTLMPITLEQMHVLQSNFSYGSSSRRGQNTTLDNEEVDVDEHMNTIREENICINSTSAKDSRVETYVDHVGVHENQRRSRGYRNIAHNYQEGIVSIKHILPSPRECPHCHATLFHRESLQICCLGGTLQLPPYTSPPELLELFSAQTPEGRHFRQYIRVYNNAFAFTSMGVQYDENLAGGGEGIYTFRAHGAIYHRIGSLIPVPERRSRYAQSYILDTDHEVQSRMLESDSLHRNLVVKIQNILQKYNPFVQVLRQLGQRQDLPTCQLLIKQQAPNMHQYSMPTASQVAAVIVDGNGSEDMNLRDIIVQTVGGNLMVCFTKLTQLEL